MEVSRRSIREGKQARTEIDVSHLSSRIIRVGNKSKNDPDWNTIDFRRCPKISGCGCNICD